MLDLPAVKDMTKEEVQKAIKALAFGCGIEKYKQEHPGASEHEAEEWAYDNWKQFKDRAYFLLAVIALREEIAVLASALGARESGLRIGVVWQGNPRHGWDRHRSLPLACLEPLARIEGVRLVSLQKGPGREQIAEVARRFSVLDLGEELDESGVAFVDTAAVMQSLDLVVTVDTASAHVAGALGVPVWLALAAIADWRWLRQREDTPWYPIMRLFRQECLGDWRAVFTRMADELRPLVAARSKSRIAVGVVPGELIDRLTILEIKAERLADPGKRAAVLDELAILRQARNGAIAPSAELERLTAALRAVNEGLWDSEDRLRLCERAGEFGAVFIEEARSVYLRNDRRAALKQQINAWLCVRQGEPKAYPDYGQSVDDPAANS